MKKISLILLISCGILLLNACGANNKEHQHTAITKKAGKSKSPSKMAMANIGNTHVHIEYNSPAVRNRIIWGGLVPYNQVWVTGAHNATSISFSKDVKINEKNIKKGKYGLFTIPNPEEWTVILNTNWQQHLTDEYSDSEDVIRFKVKPLKNDFTENLTYQVIPIDTQSGKVEITWEKIKISFLIYL
jgi:hypothetical protein